MAERNGGKKPLMSGDSRSFTPMVIESSNGVSNGAHAETAYSYAGKATKRKNTVDKTLDLESETYFVDNHENGYDYSEKDENPSLVLILLTVMLSAFFYSFFLGPLIHKITGNTSPNNSRIATTYSEEDCRLASSESFGFFNDIPIHDWKLMKERVKNRKNHYNMANPSVLMDQPMAWYQNNFEPDFTCAHERRVGGMGDGPKWVCDPHRIYGYAKARNNNGGNDCLVYSVGSEGNFEFEIGLQKTIAERSDGDSSNKCEIHTFDPGDYSGDAPEGIHYHAWGLESSSNTEKESNYKSFQETIKELGHEGRFIDIFKIDCEGCEWRIYKDLLNSEVTLMQILVEVHSTPSVAIDFFETLQKAGYVTFHKEPNIMFGGGTCQEYAMIKVAPSFFQNE